MGVSSLKFYHENVCIFCMLAIDVLTEIPLMILLDSRIKQELKMQRMKKETQFEINR